MPIATGLALGLGLAAGAAGSIGSAAIGSSAAGHAADTQAQAAEYAANLQKQEADQALAFNENQYNNSLAMGSPWLSAGQGAVANLASLLGVLPSTPPTGANPIPVGMQEGQSVRTPEGVGGVIQGGKFVPLTAEEWQSRGFDWGKSPVLSAQQLSAVGWGAPGTPAASGTNPAQSLVNPALGAPGSLQFKPPDALTEQNDPGYQARLKLAQDTLEHSAAARGGLLTGGFAKDLNQFSQDYASNEYGNVYNRALSTYQTKYNALANLAGMGQITAGQLSNSGTAAAGNNSNVLLNLAQMLGNQANNAGAARASGYIGSANAWGGALGNIGGNIGQYLMLQQLLNNQGGGGGGGAATPFDPLSATGY